MFIRASYNYDVDAVSRETGLFTDLEDEPSMTVQSFKEECDINEIVRRFGLTGEMPNNFRMPISGDFTGVSDFKSAMDLLIDAQDQFDSLPAGVREQFANDPAELITFLENPDNRDKAIDMGLIARPPEVTRDAVVAIDELKAAIVDNK